MEPYRRGFNIIVRITAGLIILFFSLNFKVLAQTEINGVINTLSARVEAVYCENSSDIDSVLVNDPTGFIVGDTILIHISVGASFISLEGSSLGKIGNPRNSGKYAIFIIKDIDPAGKIIILNSTLPEFSAFQPGEFGQIIKIPTYRRAVVNGIVTCNPYDTISKTGGIIAMIVQQGLVVNGEINADTCGFPGGKPDDLSYTGTCSSLDPGYSEKYLTESQSYYGAHKGYGIVGASNEFIRGNGAVINGGGGGNGKFSGGGGGANGGSGGQGGREYSDCVFTGENMGGIGGRAIDLYYYINSEVNRISFGGGGGTSSQSLPDFKATPGGRGGGIVIIICDSLIGNGKISANGQDVIDLATAGGGGGGAGGTIVLHVNKVSGNPKILAKGGEGGSINSLSPKGCGPGGGGGSGVIWHNNASLSGPTFTLSAGESGTYKADNRDATGGTIKAKIANLKIPIRGFIFNYIPDPDTICYGNSPQIINASPPIGGTGVFTYNWLESADGVNWTDASGTKDQLNYTPPPTVNTTTYYKRTVFNAPAIHDTSRVVKMYVMPVISNNQISPDTTVCYNLNAGVLYPSAIISGGTGSYKYKWEKSDDVTFTSPDSVGNLKNFQTPEFTSTSWYRRIATSGPSLTSCKNTSNAIKITVLPLISNNIIASGQEICNGRIPELLIAGSPAGGNSVFSYKWQETLSGSSSWNTGGAAVTYQPGSLSQSHDYRRIVYSGLNNTCKDTSGILTVTVMPDISNNIIDPIIQNILCSGLQADIITASTPSSSSPLSGGNGSYSYTWQINNSNAAGGSVESGFNPGFLTTTANIRRIVSSGTNPVQSQRCLDTSTVKTISVLENISNNVISNPKLLWCEGKTPGLTSGSIPLNGDNTYVYSWQSRINGTWTNRSESTQNLNTPVISASVDFRRIVKSGLNGTCKDTSNVLSFIMQDSIRNNFINNNNTVFVCFDEDSTIQATLPSVLTGGDGVSYTYLWKESNSQTGPFTDATQTGRTNADYLTETIQSARYYKRSVTSGDCENTSDAVKTEPLSLPVLNSLTTDISEICFNKLSSFLNVNVQSGLSPYILTFTDGQGFTDSRTLTGNSGSILPVIANPPLNPGYVDYSYKIISVKDAKGCFAKSSSLIPVANLRVFTIPMPVRISDPVLETCSSTLKISVNKSFGTSSWHLRNINGIAVDNLTEPDINLTASYNPDRDQASATLVYVEDIANCPSDSIYFDAVLYNNPDPIDKIYKVVDNVNYEIGDTLIIFISDNQTLTADNITTGIPGWHINAGSGELSSESSLITTIEKLKQGDPSFLEYSISNGVCPANRKVVKIIRKELLVYDGFSPNGDGINDELWAVGLADEEVDFKLQLFSNSGNFLKEITRKDIKEFDYPGNQVVLWDGTTEFGGLGNIAPDGTYYYVLVVKYRGESYNKRGFIVIKN